MNYTIKQTTEIAGLSADTLRYYEKEGVISPKRHENGYRFYDENDISALKYIIVMKYAHFTLTEMKDMEKLQAHEQGTQCNEVARRILTAKVAQLNQAILNYQKIVMLFEELLPMVESADAFYHNQDKINGFVEQIFDDIKDKEKR